MREVIIEGVVEIIKKTKIDHVVSDGIHRIKKNKYLFGPKLGRLNGQEVAVGCQMIYYPFENKGIKIYYSVQRKCAERYGKVVKIFDAATRLWIEGLGVKPYEIIAVRLNNINAFGILIEHVNLPEAWYKFLRGNYYDWECIKHKDHSTEGYKAFLYKTHYHNIKLGDVGWDVKENRWYLMDVGMIC